MVIRRYRACSRRCACLLLGVVALSVAVATAFVPYAGIQARSHNRYTLENAALTSPGGGGEQPQQQQQKKQPRRRRQERHAPSDISEKRDRKRRRKKRRGDREPAGVESIFWQSPAALAAGLRPLTRVHRVALRRLRRYRGHGNEGDDDNESHARSGGAGHHVPHSHSLDDSLWPSSLTERGVRDGEAQLYLEQGREEGDDISDIIPDVWRLEETKTSIRNGEYGWAVANEAEEARLAAMKLLLEQDFEVHLGKERSEAFPDVYGELRLLRFLRKDKQQDPISAATRYRAFMQWRRDNDVDRVRADVERNNLFRPPERLDRIAQLVPCRLSFNESALISTKDTVPAVLYVGEWDTAQLTQEIRKGIKGGAGGAGDEDGITMEDFLEYWTYMYESIHLSLHMESVDRRHMVYVDEACDLTGMSLRQFSPAFVTTVLKPWLRMTQLNYPETTKRIFFFNPPRIINVAWNIVTPMTSPGTVAKVRFCRGFDGSVDDFILEGNMARMASQSADGRKG